MAETKMIRVTLRAETVKRMGALAYRECRRESNMTDILLTEALDARERAAKKPKA